MSIEFNVVGIFYTDKVELAEIKIKTVKGVMDRLVEKTKKNFNYMPLQGFPEDVVGLMMFNHTSEFPSRSSKHYPPGLYKLGQTFTIDPPNPYSVWQYYLFDGERRIKIDHQPSYAKTEVRDNYKIVWRLISVCNGPSQPPKRMFPMFPSEIQRELVS